MSLDVELHGALGDFTLDVAFSAPASGVTALFGPSGAGKTRVLRAVAGLDRDVRGRLRLGDRVFMDADTFVPAERRRIGYVFQESSLFAHLDVAGNIDFGLKRQGGNAAGGRQQRDALVSLLGLDGLMSRRPQTLSGGERRRVAIARALAPSPALLLLDEPLSGLDTQRRAELLPWLEALVRKLELPVLLVSHQWDEVHRLADHLVLMDAGRVRASGTLGKVLGDLNLPLARSPEATVVLNGTVSTLDERWGLASVQVGGVDVTVPADGLEVGKALRLRIAARDVSIALDPPGRSSILNVLPVTVTGRRDAGAQCTLELSLPGGGRLLARITQRSASELDLGEGASAFAQVKSVAVLP